MKITAADIIELGHLKLRTVGHNKHGAYVAIDSSDGSRVAYFKFADEKIHFYEGYEPTSEQKKILFEKIEPWFKNKKNFNHAAKAWNAMGLSPTIQLKG